MVLSIFLHFYQPYYQQEDILERIVNESYRPIIRLLNRVKKGKLTVNVSGSLVRLLVEKGYGDVVNSLGDLVDRGRIELTGSAAYHAFLPLIDVEEAQRQIQLNERILQDNLGLQGRPKGFFSPELAFDYRTAEMIYEMGYQWMVAPQIAYGAQPPYPNRTFVLKDLPGLKIFFRHKRSSVLILSGITRTVDAFREELGELFSEDIYLLPIMDAETFGHHRPGLEDFLEELVKSEDFESISVSEIAERFKDKEEVTPRESTWSNEEQDFWLDREKEVVSANPFLLWKDPSNPIHLLQWEFLEWVIGLVGRVGNGESEAREALDVAVSSDQFWWASAKPWWSLEMIELGSYQLKEVVRKLPQAESLQKKAEDYYRGILDKAFQWQRSGKIRRAHQEAQDWKKTPFKERAPAEWYNQVILEFEDQMKQAAARRDFEKAIKWRDAITKLKKGTDIYDVLHVVNELHTVRKIPSLKPILQHYPEEISDFARENFVDFCENDLCPGE